MSDATAAEGPSFDPALWLVEQPDPILLPILARFAPPSHLWALAQMADIAGSRGGVSPPWPLLADHVSQALATRWQEFDSDSVLGILQTLPRTVRFLTPEAREAIPDNFRAESPCVEAAIIHADGDAARAEALASYLLKERKDYDRRGLSLLASLIELPELLADRSEYALEGWLDLARAGLLTQRRMYEIEGAIRESFYYPGAVVAALLGPALDNESARPLARYFATDSPDGLPDWYVALLLSRAVYRYEPALLLPWTQQLYEPYREPLARLLETHGKSDREPGPDSLSACLRAHPVGGQISSLLTECPPEEAASLAAAAIDKIFDLWAGAGPPQVAILEESTLTTSAPPPPPASTAPPATESAPSRPRRRRSLSDRFRSVFGRGDKKRGPGSAAPPQSETIPSVGMGADDISESWDDVTMSGSVPPDSPELHDDAGVAPPPPPSRSVQAVVEHGGERRLSFVAGERNEVLCWIGPDDDDSRLRVTATEMIDEDRVPEEGISLDVVLSFESQSQTDTILLKKDLRSRTGDCRLPIDVPAGETHVIAEIAFLHKGRVFEFVRIDGPVVQPGEGDPDEILRLKTLAQRREDIELADRESIDAVVLSHKDGIQTFGPLGAARFTLSSTTAAVHWLNDQIFSTEKSLVRQQARAGEKYALSASDPDTLKFFRDLALHGNSLYKELKNQGFVDPGERIQLMNMDPRSYVPLEFVYDRGSPVEGAWLCSGWQEALAGDSARCPSCKPAAELTDAERDQMPEICPLGFWSLQKIIERHDASLDPDEAQTSAPVDGANLLPPITSALFGSSFRVKAADREETESVLKEFLVETHAVDDWSTWKDVVQHQSPQLFVAMPHHGVSGAMDTLEIGDGKTLTQDRLSNLYVTPSDEGPGPIVVLFGCETQRLSEMGYVSFARDFARNRAAIVVGTMAKVLGRHAAPVAQCLVREFAGISEPERAGVLLRRIRRRMLAEGYLMALCLVALGDGDWWLSPGAAPEGES